MGLLSRIFADRARMWEPLCPEIGGQYVRGGFWKSDWIEIPHGPFLILLVAEDVSDEDVLEATVLRADVDLREDASLFLARHPIVNKGIRLLDSALGSFAPHVTVLPDVVDDCVVVATDRALAEAVFGDARLKELIAQQPDLFSISVDRPATWPWRPIAPKAAVEVLLPYLGDDLNRLARLVELMRRLLDVLKVSGLIAPRLAAASQRAE